MKGLLTPKEVADLLRVRPDTVRAWLRSGRLPGVRVGRFWRLRPSDLEAFLEPHRPDSDFARWLESWSSDLPPYDWGPKGVPPLRRVQHVPGEGFVVENREPDGEPLYPTGPDPSMP